MQSEFNFHELKSTDRLPSPSGTALAIMRLTQRNDATVQSVAHLVQTDPALSGRILRIANSPAAGQRRPVVNVLDAVMILGMSAVRQIAISLSLIGANQQGPCKAFDYPAYWSTALARAVAIQLITGRERTVSPEESFTLGLLADVGRLALATAWPNEYGECLQTESGPRRLSLQRERFAIDETDLSVMLLADWGFPAVFLDALKLSLAETQPEEDSRASRLARQLVFAYGVAKYCMADSTYRKVLLATLCQTAGVHGLELDGLAMLLDTIENQWREWGKLIGVTTELRQSHPEPEATPAVDKVLATGMDILLVDDDPMMLARLSKQLSSIGHRVAACRDGEAALRYALEHQPNLVITDWHMQPVDGIELCKTLRVSPLAKSLYIIMLTASETEDALVEAFDAGIDDYVTKPVSPRVFNARIRAAQRIITLQKELSEERKEIEVFTAELAVANRRLEQMANTDLLTGLPNRRYGMNRLEQEWAGAIRFRRPISVMVLDLDHFKTVNDSLGHDVGDRVLIHCARIMRETIRASDVVCRLGGEEFLVIAPNTDAAAAMKTAERVRKAIEEQQPAELSPPGRLTVSIGVASSFGSPAGWHTLIKLADQALYRVKQSTRNGVQLAEG